MFTSSMPNLFTRDIGAVVAFYRDELGFTQGYRVPATGSRSTWCSASASRSSHCPRPQR